jgi:hypothetical protein
MKGRFETHYLTCHLDTCSCYAILSSHAPNPHRIGRLADGTAGATLCSGDRVSPKTPQRSTGHRRCLGPPTSYALQSGYEMLLKRLGRVTVRDIEQMAERLTVTGDGRDVLNARVSVARLLGLRSYE